MREKWKLSEDPGALYALVVVLPLVVLFGIAAATGAIP
jgi:hypothetical protein